MCFYKCIVNINLLDVIKRNKQKTWCMNTFLPTVYYSQEIISENNDPCIKVILQATRILLNRWHKTGSYENRLILPLTTDPSIEFLRTGTAESRSPRMLDPDSAYLSGPFHPEEIPQGSKLIMCWVNLQHC
jgi:hypothetical protein